MIRLEEVLLLTSEVIVTSIHPFFLFPSFPPYSPTHSYTLILLGPGGGGGAGEVIERTIELWSSEIISVIVGAGGNDTGMNGGDTMVIFQNNRSLNIIAKGGGGAGSFTVGKRTPGILNNATQEPWIWQRGGSSGSGYAGGIGDGIIGGGGGGGATSNGFGNGK